MKVLGCNDEIVDELVEVIVGVEVVAKLRLTLEVVIFDVANSLTFSIIIIVKTITSIHIKLSRCNIFDHPRIGGYFAPTVCYCDRIATLQLVISNQTVRSGETAYFGCSSV